MVKGGLVFYQSGKLWPFKTLLTMTDSFLNLNTYFSFNKVMGRPQGNF